MGRRLNISTPAVINTELIPLDESFQVEGNGQTEQWYYDNTQQYAPNRKITPLTLTPILSVYDKDTQMSYKPSFYYVSWYENAYRTDYIEKHYYALSNYNTAGSGLYPSDITSWNESLTALVPYSYPQQPQSKPYIWVKKYKSVGGVTTETYSLFEDNGNSIYIRGYAFSERPSSPEEGDIALNIGNDDYGFEVYEDGQWVQEESSDGEAFFEVDVQNHTLYVNYDQSPFWKAKEYNINENGGYVETEITNTTESSSADYVKQGDNLLVKKNVSYSRGVTIKCKATYIDPRDSGVTYTVEDSVNLTTNRTADVVFPEVAITSPSARSFNPLVDTNSQYEFKAAQTNSPVQPMNTDVRRYHVNVNGTEEIVDNGDGAAPYMDIRYGDEVLENQHFLYRQAAGGTLVGQDVDTAFIERIKGDTFVSEDDELVSVTMNSIKTTGFNQWDEQWETNGNKLRSKNFIRVLPNATYYKNIPSSAGYSTIEFYDENYERISSNTGDTSGTITMVAMTSYIKFEVGEGYGTIYNHDICINISDPDKNGTYEPYEEKTQTLPITTMKGKLNGGGNSVVIFPDGMKKAGTVYDELKVEGGVVKAIKRIGSRDMGTLTWSYNSSASTFSASLQAMSTPSSSANKVCPIYEYSATLDGYGTFLVNGDSIVVHDNTYSDAATFKAAMNGVMVYYEIVFSYPLIYVIDPFVDFVWYGIKNDQEVLIDKETFPWYIEGQGADTLVVDAMYGEQINVVLRAKMMNGDTLSPSKAYASISWRTPNIDSIVQSDNGGAVRSNTKNMTFDTIINVNGQELSDSKKHEHLAFNWKIHKSNATANSETDKGWGERIAIDASELRNVRQTPTSTLASTIVYSDVYMYGAYEEVMDDNQVVTEDDGKVVYDRFI